jgi:hypothetical protein
MKQTKYFCHYSNEEIDLKGLKQKLIDFHELEGIKGNGDSYAVFIKDNQWKLAVDTWDGEGVWERFLTLKDCNL